MGKKPDDPRQVCADGLAQAAGCLGGAGGAGDRSQITGGPDHVERAGECPAVTEAFLRVGLQFVGL